MMKSSFKKLYDFTLSKSSKDKRSASGHHHQHGDDMDTTTKSMQVLTDMREQYDGLLAAAQSISGSSYDFSRSIHEMASYMLETFGKIGDGDTGSSFSMLGKVQYEISKLLDLYAAHVSQTIIKPTENLLRELESVEEIKKQYEETRELYTQISLQKTKGGRKKRNASEQQLMAIKEQLNTKAALLDLRFQSLRHGRELSLITQAARHHMAQVHLFGKGLNSLNAVESIIKHLSDELHIDQTLCDGDVENASSYEAEVQLLGKDDEEESTPSSPSSSQPMTAERIEHALLREAGSPNLLESSSKSGPLHPSLCFPTKNSPVVPDVDEEMLPEKELATYALPSPTGPTARFYNPATNSGFKADVPRHSELPEFRRVRTSSAGSFEETRGLAGLSKGEMHKRNELGHATAREEGLHAWKEKRSSYHPRRSPSHSHSTSFSEGLHPSSVPSYGHLASVPTFSYKQTMRDNDADVGVTHAGDPLHRSGPIERSAPWGFVPLRVSPCASPPVSHLSPPLISELHKLPAPPPAPPKSEPVITHSAPLGRKAQGHVRRSVVAPPLVSSSAKAIVKKSRSIPSSVNFTKLMKSDDSPVIESP